MQRKRNNTVDHKRALGEEHKEDDDGQPDFKKQLQIFQSESKFDDFEGSQYEGGADVISRPSRPREPNQEDDDVRSGNFQSELREQFLNANPAKKVGGILKYNPGTKQEVSKQEEYQRRYDDYYQDANNMIFHTGTFNGEEENRDEDI